MKKYEYLLRHAVEKHMKQVKEVYHETQKEKQNLWKSMK